MAGVVSAPFWVHRLLLALAQQRLGFAVNVHLNFRVASRLRWNTEPEALCQEPNATDADIDACVTLTAGCVPRCWISSASWHEGTCR
jgi:hypothetical protein